ncbi:MAG: tRNA (adenosine(37)-N6)-threonylcarbamoyltransferase complex dimerization subunit type 1 TsaB, partial [Paracoccaceae bacterium]|nr:tRNA (adenosine(37)-N6)-threonylcarbamoyltransferase complex dimerization subunit type 1 TsaB [Paracoccaceae bacterium]
MPSDILLLAFDTSAAHCAAALLSGNRAGDRAGNRVLAQRTEPMEKGQAERLLPMLTEVLEGAGYGWSDLGALAVGTGPGNFTGIRIAVSAARGLALSLGIPAIGVTRLEALAHGLPRPLVVLEDARRDEVYVQQFDTGTAEITTPDRLPDLQGIAVTGSAASVVPAGQIFAPAHPPAVAIGLVALLRLDSPHPRPAPFYLRLADAAP